MNMIKIIISLFLLVCNLSAVNEQQTDILVNYKYKNLDYIKKIDNHTPNGEYKVNIIYSPKIIKKDMKYKQESVLQKDNLVLKQDESKEFKIEFEENLNIEQDTNFEIVYQNLNPLTKSQNFIEYEMLLLKDSNKSVMKFTNSDLDLDLDLDLELDLQNARYKPKDKIYLIKRMLGLKFDDIWRTTSIEKRDLIQRQFDKKLTYNDVIEIWTIDNVELNNIVFYQDNKIDLPISFLSKKSSEGYNIYTLEMSKFLAQYFPTKKEIELKELQIFLDGRFKIGDVQKLRFLHNKIKMENVKNYQIEHIYNNTYRHKIDLKDYYDYKISSIRVTLFNTEQNILILKDFKASFFNAKKMDIPIVLDKYFPVEVKVLTYDELKSIDINKYTSVNEESKTIVFNEKLNLPKGYMYDFKDNMLGIIKIGKEAKDINITVPFNFENKKLLNISLENKKMNEYLSVNKHEILFNIPKEYFLYHNNLLVSNLKVNYIDYKLSLKDIIKDKKLFYQTKNNFLLDLNVSNLNLKTDELKYFKIDSIVLTPNFEISKKTDLKIIDKDEDYIKSDSSKFAKIVKILFYLLLIFILFKLKSLIWFMIKTSLGKIKFIIESALLFSFGRLRIHSLVIYMLFYLIISCILYIKLILLADINTSSMYVSFAGIFFVVGLSYLSLYLRPWLLTKHPSMCRKIYRKGGSIYFTWAILFLILTASFVSIKLEPIAEQFVIIAFYLLLWGVFKEMMVLRKSDSE